jgi:hypothetical protein
MGGGREAHHGERPQVGLEPAHKRFVDQDGVEATYYWPMQSHASMGPS